MATEKKIEALLVFTEDRRNTDMNIKQPLIFFIKH